VNPQYFPGRGFWGQSFQQIPPLPPPPPGVERVVTTVDSNTGLTSPISFRFARAPFIAVVDISEKSIKNLKIISNPYAGALRGAGMGLGQWIVSSRASAVIASRLGPNIGFVLQQAGVKVFFVPPGTPLREALKQTGLVEL